MAYFAPYIDASGIHLPTYADRLSDLCAAYRSIFGQEAELSPAVSAQISAYIREIPGVLEVGNVQFSVSSCSFSMPALCGQGRETHRSGLKPAFRQQKTGAAAPVKKDYYPIFLITGDLNKPKDSCQVQNILIAWLVKTAVPSPP